MNFFLQKVSIWINIQIKFQVPGLHSIEENAMLTYEISKLFIRRIVQL